MLEFFIDLFINIAFWTTYMKYNLLKCCVVGKQMLLYKV